MQALHEHAQELVTFWFGALTADGWCEQDNHALWFGARAEDDALLAQRFGTLVDKARSGALADWETHSSTANMALLLLTDQLPRAIYRNSAQAFASDEIARTVCRNGIVSGLHTQLPPAWRRFYYLPLEHSESLSDQRDCVRLFTALLTAYPQFASGKGGLEDTLHYARLHCEIIETFGRFPHRNAILGRASSDAEKRYLASGAERFGQGK